MFKPKMIRLIIYLVISIGLIVLLVNMPTETKIRKKEAPIDSEIREVIKRDTLGNKLMLRIGFVDSVSYYKYFIPLKTGIPVDPSYTYDKNSEKPIIVYIDSNHVFHLENKIIEKDSLKIGLQRLFNNKLEKGSFILSIDKNVDTELTVFILDLANKNEWKVGIATKN